MKHFIAIATVAVLFSAVYADTKSDLIQKGNELVKKAEEALAKVPTQPGGPGQNQNQPQFPGQNQNQPQFPGQNQHQNPIAELKTDEEAVKKLVAELQAATDETKVAELQKKLTAAEQKLAQDLSHVPHQPTAEEAKSGLIEHGQQLVKQVEAAKKDVDEVSKLITELQSTTDATKVKEIEAKLAKAEQKLAQDLHGQPNGQNQMPNGPNGNQNHGPGH